MKLKTRKIKKPDREIFYLIIETSKNGYELPRGFMTKFRNTRTEEHPWKLFLYLPGQFPESRMVTVSYGKSFHDSRRELLRIAEQELTCGST